MGGAYKACFAASGAPWGGPTDCTDSFTFNVPYAFVTWPTTNFLGIYDASTNVGQGTGRFASATGRLSVTGPFFVWPDTSSPFGVSGAWNATVSGYLCGVQ